jgi:SAM-dependent methyltransferase
MHWTVGRTFRAFIPRYIKSTSQISVLEIGSQNYNGGLRDLKLDNMDWLGVDLLEGTGVDQVIRLGEPLPFDAESFDLVVASSVFEHDIQFWNTFLEMVRVLNSDGVIILIMPSNGQFHRYPLDAFRFYPDSGIALAKWADYSNLPINLVESFTTVPEIDAWADFVAIFSKNSSKYIDAKLGEILHGENWVMSGELVESTYQELPYELRKINELGAINTENLMKLESYRLELNHFLSSKSWRYTKIFRLTYAKFQKLL